MEKQTIFKGVINGVEFDNVSDYNKEMEKLLSEGATINASSQTSIKSKCPDCELQQNPVTLLPGFDGKGHYIDSMISDDPEENDKLFEELADIQDKLLPKIQDQISKMNKEEAMEYMSQVTKVINEITQDKTYTQDIIDKYVYKLNILDNCLSVIDLYSELYGKIHKSLSAHISNKPDIKKIIEDQPQSFHNKDSIDSIKKYLKKIFE